MYSSPLSPLASYIVITCEYHVDILPVLLLPCLEEQYESATIYKMEECPHATDTPRRLDLRTL